MRAKRFSTLLRIIVVITLMAIFSATAKWILFSTVLEPDSSGRQQVKDYTSKND
tara:strand:- start:2395 stop:2556 length:162 start_codon:yes stop_codon:yes gene_type:complete